ncbi:hypothetical protein SLA2020_466960 [Shorea laevis]
MEIRQHHYGYCRIKCANHERKKHSKKHKDEKGGAFEGEMIVEDEEKPTPGELIEEVGEKRKHKVDGKVDHFEESGKEINGETGGKVRRKEPSTDLGHESNSDLAKD